jgi:glycosyltransferase involved in cell wall biosynthesis
VTGASWPFALATDTTANVSPSAAVTVVMVNYRTLDLTRGCVEGLLSVYPDVPLLLVDNASGDASTEYLRTVAGAHDNVTAILNPSNRYHGPALDQAVRAATTPFAFTIDSDCEIRRGGFLEATLDRLEDPRGYAVGDLRFKSRFGYTYAYERRTGRRRRIPYAHPAAMLLRRELYLRLPPFAHHGAPCLRNMAAAQRAGLAVHDFPIDEYVHHLAGGSSLVYDAYGPRTRRRQRLDHALERLAGGLWRDPTLVVRYSDRGEDADG